MNKLTPKELDNLKQIYLASRNRLLNTIVNYQGVGTKTYYNTVLQHLNRELEQLRRASSEYVDTAIPREYEQGLRDVYNHFTRNNLLMKRPGMWADIHTEAVYNIAREMQFHIEEGLAQAGRQIQRYADTARDEALRAAGLLTSGEKIAAGATTIDMKNRMIEQLKTEGFMTVQYGQGARAYRVPLDVYANMVARSTTREAGNIARENQLTENGYDLVEMTEHYPTCEVCAPLQGRVYSISGKDPRFPALSVAFSSGYHNVHPNCRHSIVPWLESLHTLEEVEAAIRKSNTPIEDTRSRQEVELYKKQQAENRKARQDLYQYERYRAVIGEDAPQSYGAFRRLKKAGGDNWEMLQSKYKLYNQARREGVLPNAFHAATPEEKFKDYLLNFDHPTGKHKAHVINSVLGYNKNNWAEFSDKLYREVQKSPVTKVTPFTFSKGGATIEATKYEVPIIMSGKKSRMLRLQTVWQVDKGSSVPRFITATFIKKKGGQSGV